MGVRPTFFDFNVFSKKNGSYRPQLKVPEPLRQLIVIYFFTSATVGSSSGNSSSRVLVGSLADIDFKSTSSSNIRKLKLNM